MFWRLVASSLTPAPGTDPDATGCWVFDLDANFHDGGPWAGVAKLIESAYLGLQRMNDTLTLQKHEYALYMLLPAYRDVIKPRYFCLTDTAVTHEKTRFYPIERTYRTIHGLVELVLHWKQLADPLVRWTLIVRNFDDAQHLSRRFFTELARRSAGGHGIDVIIQTAGSPLTLSRSLRMAMKPAASWVGELPPAISHKSVEQAAARVATEAEAELEQHHPTLLHHHRVNDDLCSAAILAAKVLRLYNRRAYYHEAITLIDLILPRLDEVTSGNETERMNIIIEVNSCLVATGNGERAFAIINSFAIPFLSKPHLLANANYMLAMHCLRYVQDRDLQRAEYHMLQAVRHVQAARNDPDVKEFSVLAAFIDNGLALVRVRQGRHQEALELCQAAYRSVTSDLGESRHVLHRSVLKYNMGQVHASLGQLPDALRCYQNAIDMDPYYAEYHAEVGNILQQMNRFDQAIEAYARALQYSPCYPEVFFNRAICHAAQEQWTDALHYSAMSLELNPTQSQLHVARAEILADLGQSDDAIVEYDNALGLDDSLLAVRVNRAVLHFNNSDYDAALSDMNEVIARDPADPSHYENRSAIYQALGYTESYLADLNAAEHLRQPA